MPLDSPARHEPGSPRLEARLRRELQGEVLFDRFSRGRYSTDASIYQIEPLGVVVPKDRADVTAALTIAREEGVPVLPRGGGTSQCGQTVARALVLDCSKFMDRVVALDAENRRVTVQPGVVLERLNASLRRHKLFYPVDVSTGDRATIGGMTANNSCGPRSIRYGNMVHNARAMDATRHIVKLGPSAVELVDRTMIELARDIAMFRPIVDRFVQGEPEAILLTEFAGEDADDNLRRLGQLVELIGDLGFPGAVVEATDPALQSAVWNVRKEGLNIMMSMKGDGKPISFIEDCAVRLEDLAEYTDRLTEVFRKHGTYGTWYAHASVGCLHVRPVLNVKEELGAKQMRAIAEEAFAIVRGYKRPHSGEHGDGLVRSEFHEAMFGKRIVAAFKEVKTAFDKDGLFNPGKIVRPSKMDDRSLFRFKPGYRQVPLDTVLDWSEWGGFANAAEMCNNNGACRKSDPGVMCPSYRATGDEQHLTRGRANTLRLALSGQLGPEALVSDEMRETMALW